MGTPADGQMRGPGLATFCVAVLVAVATAGAQGVDGARKAVSAVGEPGCWAFAPRRDEFRPDALLDLRSLNEKEAGESGFIRTDGSGGFLLGSGKPVRFWAVNTSVGREKGRCRLDTPKAQGVAAFFKNQKTFNTHDLAINCENEYGAVLVVAMDDQPIARSRKLLVQVGTQCRPTRCRERPVSIQVKEGTFPGFEVLDFGQAPWQVVRARVSLTIANPNLTKATSLDANGNTVGPALLSRDRQGVQLAFPDDAMYVVVQSALGRGCGTCGVRPALWVIGAPARSDGRPRTGAVDGQWRVRDLGASKATPLADCFDEVGAQILGRIPSFSGLGVVDRPAAEAACLIDRLPTPVTRPTPFLRDPLSSPFLRWGSPGAYGFTGRLRHTPRLDDGVHRAPNILKMGFAGRLRSSRHDPQLPRILRMGSA